MLDSCEKRPRCARTPQTSISAEQANWAFKGAALPAQGTVDTSAAGQASTELVDSTAVPRMLPMPRYFALVSCCHL